MTTVEPKISDPDTSEGDPRLSHLVSHESWYRGYTLGEMITALCGHRFIPSRDPEQYPLCQKCKEAAGRIDRSKSN